jgi:anti-sigma-K factor RskA
VSVHRAPHGGDHETYDELAVGWALHALEPEDEAVFLRHLPDCARCARTVAETGDVMAAMAEDVPGAEPSEQLRDRLRAAVEQTEQVHRPEPPAEERPPPPVERAAAAPPPVERRAAPVPAPGTVWSEWPTRPGRRRRLPVALVAAAVAAVLGLGAWNVTVEAARQQAEATAAQEGRIIDALTAPGQATVAPVDGSDGHEVAAVVARRGAAQVVTWGLRRNDAAATTYVLWGVQQQNTPVALGTFDVVTSGIDLRTVGAARTGLDGYGAYAISLEQGRRAPQTPTRIVATGQVAG